MAQDQITRTEKIGHITFTFISDKFHHELLDTEVRMNGQYWCSIFGAYISFFVDELRALIQKYRI